jgi:hypothetical protein
MSRLQGLILTDKGKGHSTSLKKEHLFVPKGGIAFVVAKKKILVVTIASAAVVLTRD